MGKVKVIHGHEFLDIIDAGNEAGYSRTLEYNATAFHLTKLSADLDLKINEILVPVVFSMLHDDAVEPYIRAVVNIGPGFENVNLDINLDTFNALEAVEIKEGDAA